MIELVMGKLANRVTCFTESGAGNRGQNTSRLAPYNTPIVRFFQLVFELGRGFPGAISANTANSKKVDESEVDRLYYSPSH